MKRGTLTRHFPTAGVCFVAELMINPAAAARADKTASILRSEYQRYVDVFSYSSALIIETYRCRAARLTRSTPINPTGCRPATTKQQIAKMIPAKEGKYAPTTASQLAFSC